MYYTDSLRMNTSDMSLRKSELLKKTSTDEIIFKNR